MTKLKGLGKGLEALISASKAIHNNDLVDGISNNVIEIAISEVQAGKYQPRKNFSEINLNELADSIRENGVIQPIIVRQIREGKYEIIAGERRWRASKLAQLKTIPAIIKKLTDKEALAISLIENIQRQDLNIIEEAYGYKRLIEEFNLTHEMLAKITGKSRSKITNTLRLLNVTPEIQNHLIEHKLDMGHARALLSLLAQEQNILAQEIITKQLTTAQVENKVSKIVRGKNFGELSNKSSIQTHLRSDPDILKLENSLGDKLGMIVNIKHNNSGSGKVTIVYNNIDELDNLLKFLK